MRSVWLKVKKDELRDEVGAGNALKCCWQEMDAPVAGSLLKHLALSSHAKVWRKMVVPSRVSA